MKVRVSLGRENDHIEDLFPNNPSATLKRRDSSGPTQKMAPTAAVSMAVLISLSMIVSVSVDRPGSITLSTARRKWGHVLLNPVLLRRKKKNKVALTEVMVASVGPFPMIGILRT